MSSLFPAITFSLEAQTSTVSKASVKVVMWKGLVLDFEVM